MTTFATPVTITNDSSHNGFPGFCIFADSDEPRFLVAYRVASGHSTADGSIVTKSSSDGGLTWSSATTALAHSGGFNWGAAHLTVLTNGDVILSTDRRSDATGFIPEGAAVVRSTDGGLTWGATTVIDTGFTDYGIGGPVFELESGTLLMPIYGEDTGDPEEETRLMRSLDNGATWTTISTIAPTGGTPETAYNEAGLFQRTDGTLVALVRLGVNGNWVQAESSDEGATWGALTTIGTGYSGWPKPIRYGDYVVAVFRDVAATGKPAVILQSSDEGRTWQRGQTISATSGVQMTYGAPFFW